MKKLLLAAGLLALTGLTEPQPTRGTEAAHFAVVITSTPTGWAAQCDSGCRWESLSFTCATACPAILDANGLVTLATPRPDSTSFSIVLHHDLDGARAESRGGTAWKDLGWHCGGSPCRARVDGFGVTVPAPGR